MILLVTALKRRRSDTDNNTSIDLYFERFRPIASLGVPIIAFMEDTIEIPDDFDTKYPHVTWTVFKESDLWAFKNEALFTKLPSHRSITKDTVEYMLLMNSKPEFMYMASKMIPSCTHVLWFDFGISVVVGKNSDNLHVLNRLSTYKIPVPILLSPSCYGPDRIDWSAWCERVMWRFCGGILLADVKSVETLCEETRKALLILAPSIVWEVNLWAYLEKEKKVVFSDYAADHNDSMLVNLERWLQRVSLEKMLKERQWDEAEAMALAIKDSSIWFNLCHHYRMNGINGHGFRAYQKAMQYRKEGGDELDERLSFEYTILAYYNLPESERHLSGLRGSMRHLDKYSLGWENVYNNVKHYLPRISNWGNSVPFFPDLSVFEIDFAPSSISLLQCSTDASLLHCNTRLVSYRVLDNGGYEMKLNGAPSHILRTRNAYFTLKLPLTVGTPRNVEDDTMLPNRGNDTCVLGLEDIRLFYASVGSDRIMYTATSVQYSPVNKARIVLGEYNIEEGKCKNSVSLVPPTDTPCEKNWIPIPADPEVGRDRIDWIYGWHVMQIGTLDGNSLKIHTLIETPESWRFMRGSTVFVLHENQWWGVVHLSYHGTRPSEYMHHIMVLDRHTLRPVKYTLPFFFEAPLIEYCLGFVIWEDQAIFTYSCFDRNPKLLCFPLSVFDARWQ